MDSVGEFFLTYYVNGVWSKKPKKAKTIQLSGEDIKFTVRGRDTLEIHGCYIYDHNSGAWKHKKEPYVLTFDDREQRKIWIDAFNRLRMKYKRKEDDGTLLGRKVCAKFTQDGDEL